MKSFRNFLVKSSSECYFWLVYKVSTVWIWSFWLTFIALQWMKTNFKISQFEDFCWSPGMRFWSKFDWNFLNLFYSSRNTCKSSLHLNWIILTDFHSFMQVSISSKTIPPGTNPWDTTRREQKPSPWDTNCAQKPFPRDKTGSQKPHPRDIKLENSDTISNEKLCRLNK